MESWWTDNSKQRTLTQSYSLETFGLDRASIASQFAFYNERFDVRVTP